MKMRTMLPKTTKIEPTVEGMMSAKSDLNIARSDPPSDVPVNQRLNLDRLQADIDRLEREGIPHAVVKTSDGPVAVDLTKPPEREMRIVEMLDQTMKGYAEDVRALRDDITSRFNKIADQSEVTVQEIARSLENVASRAREVIELCDMVSQDVDGAGDRIRKAHSSFMVTSRNAMVALLNVKETVSMHHDAAPADDVVARNELEAFIVKLEKIVPGYAGIATLKGLLEPKPQGPEHGQE